MKEYQYPLDIEWSTDEMVKVVALWDVLEQAYETGVDKAQFLEKYRDFKTVVKSIGEEKRLGSQFEKASGYSLYHTLQEAKKSEKKRFKMEGK